VLIVLVAIPPAAFTQPSIHVDLKAPALRAHSKLPQYNRPAPIFSEELVRGRSLAASINMPWKGMTFSIPDAASVTPDVTSLRDAYQRLSCDADVIATGHTDAWSHHLSDSGGAIYGDYVFIIDTLLKDNNTSSLSSHADIVVTRPGGSLSLQQGPVSYEDQSVPLLHSGAQYLVFLHYLKESDSYEPFDYSSTLSLKYRQWFIYRKAFSGRIISGLEQGPFEKLITNALTSCN
jgi:hypothetical protein